MPAQMEVPMITTYKTDTKATSTPYEFVPSYCYSMKTDAIERFTNF